MDSSRFYTSREVQRMLKISAATLHRLCSTGVLPSIRLGDSGHYRISEDALQVFLERNSTQQKEV